MNEDTMANLELEMLNTLPDDKLKKYLPEICSPECIEDLKREELI